jgi:hypothetical protein
MTDKIGVKRKRGGTYLAKRPLSNCTMKVKMVKRNFTIKIHWLREAASHLAYREEEEKEERVEIKRRKEQECRYWVVGNARGSSSLFG